jgi:hypothetical protein
MKKIMILLFVFSFSHFAQAGTTPLLQDLEGAIQHRVRKNRNFQRQSVGKELKKSVTKEEVYSLLHSYGIDFEYAVFKNHQSNKVFCLTDDECFDYQSTNPYELFQKPLSAFSNSLIGLTLGSVVGALAFDFITPIMGDTLEYRINQVGIFALGVGFAGAGLGGLHAFYQKQRSHQSIFPEAQKNIKKLGFFGAQINHVLFKSNQDVTLFFIPSSQFCGAYLDALRLKDYSLVPVNIPKDSDPLISTKTDSGKVTHYFRKECTRDAEGIKSCIDREEKFYED